MTKMSNVKKSIITAMCIALCVVLPLAFHFIQNAGSIFSPMHLPVLLCGLICGWYFGLLCGILGPLLSSVLTGMPPVAYLPNMIIELAVYGLVTGIMMQVLHTKKTYADLYISLIVSLISGRIIAGITQALIFAKGSYSIKIWATSYFVTCLPGVIIQLLLIPTIFLALEKANLIPVRYAKMSRGIYE